MSAHSIIPPSSAGIWGKPGGCTGWVLMSQLYPETEESPDAAVGTASHEIGAELIHAASILGPTLTFNSFEGRAATNGVLFTEEMFEGAKLYADDVVAVMHEHGVFSGPNLGIEQRLEMPAIHELSFGTCDSYLNARRARKLYVWDYKFGFEVVEAFENWQSIDYVSGLLDKLEINDQTTTVHIRIAQPRAFHRDGPIREWVVKASDLRNHINILHNNARKALEPDAECNSGSHCKHCTARHACTAALTGGTRLFEAASSPTPVELSPEALGVQLSLIKRARKQLEYLESGFEEQVAGKIRGGTLVPGWATEDKFGREKWDKPFGEVVAMGEMLGKDLRKKEPVTPKQAVKLGIDEQVITAYSTTPRTGIKIVPDNGNKAKQVFTK